LTLEDERKELFGFSPGAPILSAIGPILYTKVMTKIIPA